MCGRDNPMAVSIDRRFEEVDVADPRHKTCGLCDDPVCGHAPINFFGVMFDTELCAAHLKVASISKSSEAKDEDAVADPLSRP